ncbi:MAG: SulP family inorganic anion transporter [Bacillota bacterium]
MKKIKDDFFSGLSTATIALPQNMAYALILGINPIYGIYASVFSMIIATITNKSKVTIVGPTNMMAVALATSLSNFKGDGYLELIFLTTFLIGIFQILLVYLNLTSLISYVAHPVVVALSNGAAILIIISQLKNLVGFDITGFNVLLKIKNFLLNTQKINFQSLIIGIITIMTIFLINKLKPKYPKYLLAVIIISSLTYFTGFYKQIDIVGNIPKKMIDFSIHEFNLKTLNLVYTKAFSIALLGLIQTMAVLQAVGLKTKEKIDFDKEFKSQGIINLVISFLSGFAISTSFSNTFANLSAGAKSKLSQLFCALSIILFVIFLRPFIIYIPNSVLAGLVISAAIEILNFKEVFNSLKTTKGDAIIFLATFSATILLPNLDQAIYLGVLVSLAVVIKTSQEANIDFLKYSTDAKNKDFKLSYMKKIKDFKSEKHELRIINLKGIIHFSAADNLNQKFNKIFEPKTDFIIRMRNVTRIDITVIKVLKDFIQKVKKNDGNVMLTGVNNKVYNILEKNGIIEEIGNENIYTQQKEYFASTNEAINKNTENN